MTFDISFLSMFWSKNRYMGFSWNPIRGRWVYLSFYRTYEKANRTSAAVWMPIKLTDNLFLRIQTNA